MLLCQWIVIASSKPASADLTDILSVPSGNIRPGMLSRHVIRYKENRNGENRMVRLQEEHNSNSTGNEDTDKNSR